jgi:hypothetical protein
MTGARCGPQTERLVQINMADLNCKAEVESKKAGRQVSSAGGRESHGCIQRW